MALLAVSALGETVVAGMSGVTSSPGLAAIKEVSSKLEVALSAVGLDSARGVTQESAVACFTKVVPMFVPEGVASDVRSSGTLGETGVLGRDELTVAPGWVTTEGGAYTML